MNEGTNACMQEWKDEILFAKASWSLPAFPACWWSLRRGERTALLRLWAAPVPRGSHPLPAITSFCVSYKPCFGPHSPPPPPFLRNPWLHECRQVLGMRFDHGNSAGFLRIQWIRAVETKLGCAVQWRFRGSREKLRGQWSLPCGRLGLLCVDFLCRRGSLPRNDPAAQPSMVETLFTTTTQVPAAEILNPACSM